MTELHVSVSNEAKQFHTGHQNRAGLTLRDWLIRALETSGVASTTHPSLFGTTFEVDKDVPAIIGAFSLITNRSLEEILESWLMEEPASLEQGGNNRPPMTQPTELPDEVLSKVAQILDLGETLFEETIADAKRKIGTYPEGEKVAQTSSEVFRALRLLLGLRQGLGSDAADG
jgi:hypothetical protein